MKKPPLEEPRLLTDEEREALRQEYLLHNRLMQRAYSSLRRDDRRRARSMAAFLAQQKEGA